MTRLKGVATQTLLALTVLTAAGGVNSFMGHRETWYNLPMNRIVQRAQDTGIPGEYWINDKGCKMYGPYIICAGARNRYGEIIDTSLGKGIILDAGEFAIKSPDAIDIATDW